MAEFSYTFIAPEVKQQKSLYEYLQEPLKQRDQLASQLNAQKASGQKDLMTRRNKAIAQLMGVKGDFEGWSKQDIDQFGDAWQHSYQMLYDSDDPDQLVPMVVQHMRTLKGDGDSQARLMSGQNSPYDNYNMVMADPSLHRGEGVPQTTAEDIDARRGTFDNHTVNGEQRFIGGFPTYVGEYMHYSGQTIKEMALEEILNNPALEGVMPQFDTDDRTGITTMQVMGPDGNPMWAQPKVIGGPSWAHPLRGNRSWMQYETVSRTMTPIELLGTTNVQRMINELQGLIDTDNPSERISYDEARSRLKRQLSIYYNTQPALQQSANSLWASETFGGTKPEGMDWNDEMKNSGEAEVNGWKSPMDNFLDQVVENAGWKRNIPQRSPSSPTTPKLMWSDVDKRNRDGLPDNLAPYAPGGAEPYRMRVYGEQADIINGLAGSARLDVTIPEEISLLYAGEKVNRIALYPDDNYILVEKPNADTEGEVRPAWGDDPEGAYGDDWDFAWKKKPEPKYFIIPIRDAKGEIHEDFLKFESNLRDEYKRAGDISNTPLQDLVRNF